MKKKYISNGLVLGLLWGGGEASYQARVLESDTLTDIIEQANEALLNGDLDSGMGFESLIGAIFDIKILTTILI